MGQQKLGILSGMKGDQYTSAYTGISPPSRPLSREDLYGHQHQGLPDGLVQGPGIMLHRPAPLSPTELRGGVMVTTSGIVKSLDRPRQTSDNKGSPSVSGTGPAGQQQKSSISGMLSDFTRALGLGGSSP
ncbi:hypothetical protein OTU49_017051, partial [Cherax quadricarinatus]